MRLRILAVVLLLCVGAAAQTSLSVEQLYAFVKSNMEFVKAGTSTDREVAGFLGKAKMTERLDDRAIEQMEALGIGPKTLEALQRLRDQSKALAAARPVEPAGPPPQAPPPTSEEQGAVINEVRNYALNYSRGLPDFICTQVTRRYAAPRPGMRRGEQTANPSWSLMDTLTMRLSYFEQKEDYKVVLVNNTVVNRDYKTVDGSKVTGVFGSMMREVFERATQARFEWDHWGTLRSRLCMVFGYKVDQARSQWHITYDNTMDIVPAYHGLLYVDDKTHEVLRITLEAEGLPSGFPVTMAETTLDYGHTDISGRTFLLPTKSRTEMAADSYVARIDEEFRNYRKYTVESELKFDDATPPPLPDEKETPAPPPARKKQ